MKVWFGRIRQATFTGLSPIIFVNRENRLEDVIFVKADTEATAAKAYFVRIVDLGAGRSECPLPSLGV